MAEKAPPDKALWLLNPAESAVVFFELWSAYGSLNDACRAWREQSSAADRKLLRDQTRTRLARLSRAP